MSTRDRDRPALVSLDGSPPARVLIVRAPYYSEIVTALTDGAVRILRRADVQIEIVDVAGAFELPQAIRLALRAPAPHDGYVALGCVVRGETSHYDHICNATMQGLMHVSLTYGLAMGTGLLTVETVEQALSRAQPEGGDNKGEEAGIACLGQVIVARTLAPR